MTIPPLEPMYLQVWEPQCLNLILNLMKPGPGDEYKDNLGVTMAIPIGVGFKVYYQ